MFDLIVIGAGPGGYVAAIKAAKLGLKTAIVEEIRVGGTCLNRGCIPAKAMIHAASLYREAREEAGRCGIHVGDVSFDYSEITVYKAETTEKLVSGIEQLLKAGGITVLKGKGTLHADRTVHVKNEVGEEVYEAKNVLLASGSQPIMLPLPGMDLPGVLTSDGLFALEEMPESLVIIGGGVISCEFAQVYADLGCRVTVLEAQPRLIPNMDKEISQNLKMIMKKRGVDIHTSAAVQGVEARDGGYVCRYMEKEKECEAAGQYVLCAVGRKPNTEGLFAPDVSIQMERGRVVVDDHFRTNMEGVYAIGDLIFGMQLAHLASAQGIAAAEILAGEEPGISLNTVPGCVYTDPEIASVGMTEDEAAEAGIPVQVGKFIMSANGKSLITHEERGFIKVVAREGSHEILGAQMMCARATDMIGEFVTAIANHMSVEQLLKGMRAHPTYNEGVGEALEELCGGAIHTVPRVRKGR